MVSVHQESRASYLNTHFSTTFGVLFDKRDKLLLFHNTAELECDFFSSFGFFFCNFTFCLCQFQIFWTSSCFFHGNVNRNRYIEIVAFWVFSFFLCGVGGRSVYLILNARRPYCLHWKYVYDYHFL